MADMADSFDWVDIDFLKRIDEEVEGHASFAKYMSNVLRGIRYYSSSSEWWVPINDHEDMNISEKVPTARENIIHSTVNEMVSILLKNDPVVRTHPFHPEDSPFSDDFDSVLLAAWRNAKTRDNLHSMLKMAAIAGLGICKTGWNNANKAISNGEVGIKFIAPTDIYLDPYATNSNRGLDCRYIRHTSWQTPEAIIYRYGNEGAQALGVESETGRPKKWKKNLRAIGKKIVDTVTGGEEEGHKVDRRFPVYEYWIFPVSGRESELATGSAVDEKTYPYGLVVTRVRDKIVRTMANPYFSKKTIAVGEGLDTESQTIEQGHKMHPFVLCYWNREMDASGYNGIYDCTGMVQEQIPLQHSLDSVNRDLEQHIRTTAWPGVITVEDAFDTPMDKWEGRPGQILEINAKYLGANRRIGDVIQQFSGRNMASEAWLYRNDKRQQISQITGLKPQMVGLSPQGSSHTPAATIGTIQEASYSSIWPLDREIINACWDIAYRFMGLIQQNYKQGRLVEISEEGGTTAFIEIQQRHLAGMFKLEVVSGTTTPMYDMDKETKLMAIKQQVDTAIVSQSIPILKSTLIFLDNLNIPYSYQWIQLLKQTIQEIELAQQTLQGIGGMALMEQAGQQALPAQGGGEPGMEALAAQLGVSPDEIERAFLE